MLLNEQLLIRIVATKGEIMILSVCPSPSIDCTVEVEQLNVGRMNRIDNKIITYSGKALNAAIGVARLGENSFATGFMYMDNGSLFTETLDKEGVKNSFVWNDGSVRVNYKIVDNKSMLTEINDRGEEVDESKQNELISLVKTLANNSNVVIMSGSLPKGVKDDFYARIVKSLPKNVVTIVDSEGDKLLNAVKEGVYMVKPNLRELEGIIKRELNTKKDYIEGCKFLIEKGAKYVLLSLGREGAVLCNENAAYFCKSAAVAVNSTVGAGDSMVAAAAVMIEKNMSDEEILRSAVAAGTASITTPGTNLFYRDKYEDIYDKIHVEKIL